jgi:hypothetical protein
MELVAIDYVPGPWAGDGPAQTDWVELYYKHANGSGFLIRQGHTWLYEPGKEAPADAHGPATVQGKEAVWVDGTRKVLSVNPPRFAGWQRGVLSLAWSPSTGDDSPLPKGFVLIGPTSLGIGELVRIANSAR